MPPIIKKQTTIQTKAQPTQEDNGWPDEFVRIVMYGRSGTGKTTCWETFPGPINVLIASGVQTSGELRSIDTPENRKRIKVKRINDASQVDEWIDSLKRNIPTNVVLDHVTGLQHIFLKEVLGTDEIPVKVSWGTASIQEWGVVAGKTIKVLAQLLNLPCNCVIIAQEKETQPKEGATSDLDSYLLPTIGAAVIPSVAEWLYPAADYIVQTFKRAKYETKTITKTIAGVEQTTEKKVRIGIEYCMRTQEHEVITTKFRKLKDKKVGDVIVNPTYAKIVAALRGEEINEDT